MFTLNGGTIILQTHVNDIMICPSCVPDKLVHRNWKLLTAFDKCIEQRVDIHIQIS